MLSFAPPVQNSCDFVARIVHLNGEGFIDLGDAMAGDWVKMRHDLADDPAVISLVENTVCVDEEHVIGKLHKLWSWADQQTYDGNASSVSISWIDRYLGVSGFADVLVAVGWLTVNGDGFSIPKFDTHISQSAKQRALTARRVAKSKAKKGNAKVTVPALPREEKRREEKGMYIQGGVGGAKTRKRRPKRVELEIVDDEG